MTTRLAAWLAHKWRPAEGSEILQAYQVTFSTLHGQLVLRHLLDNVYCQICPKDDALALAVHNGRRSVVQEILENIDAATTPEKYTIQQETLDHAH